jgi:hypothetical protein
VDSRRVHAFECAAVNCLGQNGRKVRRFLDKADSKSTGGLHTHAKRCWGEPTVKAALATKNLKAARDVIDKQPEADPERDSKITAAFERMGKEKVTYSHRQHTYEETRSVTQLTIPPRLIFHVPCPIEPRLFAGWLRTSARSKL